MTIRATCLAPKFEYNGSWGVWGSCQTCGRVAWDHEQADPLADIRAVITAKHTPPAMRPITPTGEIMTKIIELDDDGRADLSDLGWHTRYYVHVGDDGVIVLTPDPKAIDPDRVPDDAP